MIDVQLVGLDDLQVRLGAVPASVALRITDAMMDIVNVLADRMRSRMAELFRTSSKMQASVATAVEAGGDAIIGTSGAYGLPYLAIQEFGGVTSPHMIFPVNAKALAFLWTGIPVALKQDKGGSGAATSKSGTGDMVFLRGVHHPGSKIPERSYARSALAMERSNIIAMIKAAVSEGTSANA